MFLVYALIHELLLYLVLLLLVFQKALGILSHKMPLFSLLFALVFLLYGILPMFSLLMNRSFLCTPPCLYLYDPFLATLLFHSFSLLNREHLNISLAKLHNYISIRINRFYEYFR